MEFRYAALFLILPESISKEAFSNPRKNLPALVAELTGSEEDDFQRVKNIHDSIALKLRYDGEAASSGAIPEQANRVTISVRSADDPNRFLSLVSYDMIN